MASEAMPRAGIDVQLSELIASRPACINKTQPIQAKSEQWGAHRSAWLGQGMSYAESRRYAAGDDVRHIDWAVTARTGQVYSKCFEAERERPVYLLVDLRAMMKFGSRRRFKSHLACQLAAQLGWLTLAAEDRIGALIISHGEPIWLRAGRTRKSLWRLFEQLIKAANAPPADTQVPLSSAIEMLEARISAAASVQLISDFNDFDSRCELALKRLAKRHTTRLLWISDPLDRQLPGAGSIASETQVIDLASLSTGQLADYQAAYTQLEKTLMRVCRSQGVSLMQFGTQFSQQQIEQQLLA